MAKKTQAEIEHEKSIREDQKYRDCVENLEDKVNKIYAFIEKMETYIAESNKSRDKAEKEKNRWMVATGITIVLALITLVFGLKWNIDSHEKLEKKMALRVKLNHTADWMKEMDKKIGLGYDKIYYQVIYDPPNVERGPSQSAIYPPMIDRFGKYANEER